jgi:hypothetical protein
VAVARKLPVEPSLTMVIMFCTPGMRLSMVIVTPCANSSNAFCRRRYHAIYNNRNRTPNFTSLRMPIFEHLLSHL